MADLLRTNARIVKVRDENRCVRCGAQGENVHHRKLRSRALKREVHLCSNLILLCGTGTTGCHGWVHGNVKEATESGWLVDSWDEARFVPVLYLDGWRQLTEAGDYYLIPSRDELRETP